MQSIRNWIPYPRAVKTQSQPWHPWQSMNQPEEKDKICLQVNQKCVYQSINHAIYLPTDEFGASIRQALSNVESDQPQQEKCQSAKINPLWPEFRNRKRNLGNAVDGWSLNQAPGYSIRAVNKAINGIQLDGSLLMDLVTMQSNWKLVSRTEVSDGSRAVGRHPLHLIFFESMIIV